MPLESPIGEPLGLPIAIQTTEASCAFVPVPMSTMMTATPTQQHKVPGKDGAQTRARMNTLLEQVAQTRDKIAFAELFAFFAPRVKGFLLRARVSAEQAEDIAQETMLKVWRKAHLFDASKATASTWIFTIARNLRIDTIRKNAKPPLDPDEPALLPCAPETADSKVERYERDERIAQALLTLPPAQQEVVKLFFMEDDPHSVIAEKLQLPLGTVKSRLRLAFEKIRKELGELE